MGVFPALVILSMVSFPIVSAVVCVLMLLRCKHNKPSPSFQPEQSGLYELLVGGAFYCLGMVFFKSDGIVPFAHAIWHMFVASGAAIHYYAIWKYLYAQPLNQVQTSRWQQHWPHRAQLQGDELCSNSGTVSGGSWLGEYAGPAQIIALIVKKLKTYWSRSLVLINSSCQTFLL